MLIKYSVYKDDVYNAILLNIKYYIYKTEKMIAVRNQRIAEFQLHWSTFDKLFEDWWHSFYSYVNSLSIEIPLNANWYSLSKYTFLVYICYTIVYFIVYSLRDN